MTVTILWKWTVSKKCWQAREFGLPRAIRCGIILSIPSGLRKGKGRFPCVYCFGTGKTRLLRNFILAICDAVNPKLKVGLGGLPYYYPNQMMHLEADISNLTADTGFVSQYIFKQGICETVEWAKKDKI